MVSSEAGSITLKVKLHFADFNLEPEGWSGYVCPWIKDMVVAFQCLEEIQSSKVPIIFSFIYLLLILLLCLQSDLDFVNMLLFNLWLL